ERPSDLVLLVAGLLADEHGGGAPSALAEDRLRPDLPEVAAAATCRRLAERGQGPPFRHEVPGRACRPCSRHEGAIPSTGGFETGIRQGCCKRPAREGESPAARTGFTTMSDHALPLRLVGEAAEPVAAPAPEQARVESYRRLADVFHDVLAEQSLDALLDRIADALADLVPHDSLTIYEADESRRMLVPVWARDKWADKILADRCPFGVGLTGWGVEHREPVLVNPPHL